MSVPQCAILLSALMNGKVVCVLKRWPKINFVIIYYQQMLDLYTHVPGIS